MLNTTGVLATMDHGITLNWEDGPTLLRMTALVSFRYAGDANSLYIRVLADHLLGDEPMAFLHEENAIRAAWIWREVPISQDLDSGIRYWTTQLSLTNTSREDIYLDSFEALRIDHDYSGQFNLGAPLSAWRIASDQQESPIFWENWSQSAAMTQVITHASNLLIQPATSSRTRPPAILVRALDDDTHSASGSLPVEIELTTKAGIFHCLVARNRTDGLPLSSDVTIVSSEFLIAAGDNAEELRLL
jgi:hypothetical protein